MSEVQEVVISQELLDWEKEIRTALGSEIIELTHNLGDIVVRVTKDGYAKAGSISRKQLNCEYLSFISAIDWMPMPSDSEDGSKTTSQPAQPKEMTFGAAGSSGRFQVFAHVQSISSHRGFTIKVDVQEDDMSVASWTDIFPGADWHERECWEMFGIDFIGHPDIRRLYLPAEFEGNPLRKDFALLARVVKPWPGLVDVEPMPGDKVEDSDDE